MNWKTARFYLRVILYILGLGFFVYFLQKNLSNFLETVQLIKLNFFPLILALLILILIYASQIFNFWIVIRGEFPQITYKSTVIAYASSFMPKYIPGYVWGYVSRGDSFKEIANVPYKSTLAGSVFEIVYFVSSGIILLGINHIIINNLNLLLIFSLSTIPIAEWYFLKVFGNRLLNIFNIDVNLIYSLKTWIITFTVSFLEWFLYGFSLALINHALAQTKIMYSFRNLLNYSAIFSESWIVGFFAFLIPMGLGIRELLITRGFQRAWGVSQVISGVIASISRILIFIAEGIWFLIALILRRLKSKPQ